MKLSLKKVRRIEKAISRGLLQDVPLQIEVNVFEDVGDLEATLRQSEDTMVTNLETSNALIALKYELRKMIDSLNQSTGISTLMAEKAEAQEKINLLSYVLSRGTRSGTIQALSAKLRSMSASDMGSYRGSDILPITILTQDQEQQIEKQLQAIRRSSESIQDQLDSLNLGTEVTLSQKQVDLLVKANII